jgi:hypothetical protein
LNLEPTRFGLQGFTGGFKVHRWIGKVCDGERLERESEKSLSLDTRAPWNRRGISLQTRRMVDNGGVEIVSDYRARRMRAQGMSFREIAAETGTSLTRVRRSLRGIDTGRMRREIRAEIRASGGLRRWWDSPPEPEAGRGDRAYLQ